MMLGLNPGLITCYSVVFGRLNTEDMEFNDILREPMIEDTDSDGIGDSSRIEVMTTVSAQISTDSWEKLRMALAGHAPTTQIDITLDYDELLNLGLIDPDTGSCLLLKGDRLISIHDEDGNMIVKFPDDPDEEDPEGRPSLSIDQARPSGFMVGQNLVVCTLAQQDRHVR